MLAMRLAFEGYKKEVQTAKEGYQQATVELMDHYNHHMGGG